MCASRTANVYVDITAPTATITCSTSANTITVTASDNTDGAGLHSTAYSLLGGSYSSTNTFSTSATNGTTYAVSVRDALPNVRNYTVSCTNWSTASSSTGQSSCGAYQNACTRRYCNVTNYTGTCRCTINTYTTYSSLVECRTACAGTCNGSKCVESHTYATSCNGYSNCSYACSAAGYENASTSGTCYAVYTQNNQTRTCNIE
ncbi:MAG TPA: hypothetical protein PLT65_01275 [Bacilli bacterium]|nr:hypothetical protein [Bacilli bacterium]